MIGLERHIEILLLSNDCVIVPDFGGFMTHHVDARFDPTDNTFLPPLRTLGFNPQLKMNDSLLAQSYVEAYDISYPEAIKRIESDVEELRQHLENEGEYEMSDIGTIFKNEDGKYEFSPCEAGILTPEFYGLSSFEMTPIALGSRQKKASIVDISVENKDVHEVAEVDTKETDNVEGAKVVALTTEDDGDRRISISVSLLRNIAAACVAVIAFLLFPSTLGNNKANVYHSHIDTELLQKLMPKDITVGKPDLSSADLSLPANSNEQNMKAEEVQKKEQEEVVAVPQTTTFCIVLASHVSMKNANAFVEHLHGKGFAEARVLIREKSSTKVVFGSYKSETDARQALNSLNTKDKDFAEGWVMELKP
ncbi:MAG: SPOR domain-containing protein [Prevotella sp.]|nr:SPOR domain-containing protein [Prevotella sp.]